MASGYADGTHNCQRGYFFMLSTVMCLHQVGQWKWSQFTPTTRNKLTLPGFGTSRTWTCNISADLGGNAASGCIVELEAMLELSSWVHDRGHKDDTVQAGQMRRGHQILLQCFCLHGLGAMQGQARLERPNTSPKVLRFVIDLNICTLQRAITRADLQRLPTSSH